MPVPCNAIVFEMLALVMKRSKEGPVNNNTCIQDRGMKVPARSAHAGSARPYISGAISETAAPEKINAEAAMPWGAVMAVKRSTFA